MRCVRRYVILCLIFASVWVIWTCPLRCSCRTYKRKLVVDCGSRNLTRVPSDISAKTFILYLNDNDLRFIEPGTFTHLKGLNRLSLSRTNLIEITPHIFTGLENLRRLSITSNKFTSLGKDCFSLLKKLNFLNLCYNHIRQIHPQAFRGLSEIESLGLMQNRLTSVDGDIFQPVSETLQELDLSKNYITFLTNGSFTQLMKLVKLDLSDNHLIRISAFPPCEKLEELDLDNNQLSFINKDTFSNLPNLHKLILARNKITYIHPQAFANLPQIDKLSLIGNKLDCDCSQLSNFLTLKVRNIVASCTSVNKRKSMDQDELVSKSSPHFLYGASGTSQLQQCVAFHLVKTNETVHNCTIHGCIKSQHNNKPRGDKAVFQPPIISSDNQDSDLTTTIVAVACGLLLLCCCVAAVMFIRYRKLNRSTQPPQNNGIQLSGVPDVKNYSTKC